MGRSYSHEIEIDGSADDVLQLFTPRGEEEWVPGWAPRYLHPETGETTEEMLFTTGAGDETTYWTCLKWEPEQHHARYLRVTPASRIAFVDVVCRAAAAGRTAVRVSYDIHALNGEGRSYIEMMDDAAFAAMIEEWAALIRKACAARA